MTQLNSTNAKKKNENHKRVKFTKQQQVKVSLVFSLFLFFFQQNNLPKINLNKIIKTKQNLKLNQSIKFDTWNLLICLPNNDNANLKFLTKTTARYEN